MIRWSLGFHWMALMKHHWLRILLRFLILLFYMSSSTSHYLKAGGGAPNCHYSTPPKRTSRTPRTQLRCCYPHYQAMLKKELDRHRMAGRDSSGPADPCIDSSLNGPRGKERVLWGRSPCAWGGRFDIVVPKRASKASYDEACKACDEDYE